MGHHVLLKGKERVREGERERERERERIRENVVGNKMSPQFPLYQK